MLTNIGIYSRDHLTRGHLTRGTHLTRGRIVSPELLFFYKKLILNTDLDHFQNSLALNNFTSETEPNFWTTESKTIKL